jgi:hypothetical protein
LLSSVFPFLLLFTFWLSEGYPLCSNNFSLSGHTAFHWLMRHSDISVPPTYRVFPSV